MLTTVAVVTAAIGVWAQGSSSTARNQIAPGDWPESESRPRGDTVLAADRDQHDQRRLAEAGVDLSTRWRSDLGAARRRRSDVRVERAAGCCARCRHRQRDLVVHRACCAGGTSAASQRRASVHGRSATSGLTPCGRWSSRWRSTSRPSRRSAVSGTGPVTEQLPRA